MKPITKKLFASAITVFSFTTLCLAMLQPAIADAAVLGNIKVSSALGQPFAAEVEIVGLQAEEFFQIKTRIASPETYEATKLEYPSIVRQIRVTAERDSDNLGVGGDNIGNGKAKLKFTSNAAINEPSLDLLVEFSTGNGRLVQKYSVLLDLPKIGK